MMRNQKESQKLTSMQFSENSFPEFQLELSNLLYEQYPVAIMVLDENGHFVSVNARANELTGYDLYKLQGPFTKLVKEEYFENAISHFHRTLTGEVLTFQCEMIHKDGHDLFAQIKSVPLQQNGEIIGVLCIAKDITDVFQKEAELRKITNSLNLAQEVAKIGSWDYDVESTYVYCSDSLFELLGIQETWDVKPYYVNLLEMVHPEDQQKFDTPFQDAIKNGTDMDVEYRIVKPDQTVITVHVIAVPKKDQHGKVVRIIGVLNDITEQVQTENQLKESEEKFETIVKNLDVGIFSVDMLTNKVKYVSPAIENITGYQAEKFISGEMNWPDIMHSVHIEAFRKLQNDLLKGKMIQHQYRIICANGEEKWIEDKTFPQLDENGQLMRIDGIIQDISERKQNEAVVQFFANHDYLTELPNRRMFDEKIKQLITKYEENNGKFSLYYIDVDRFKFVNDTLGHEIGDSLLLEISRRLSALVEKGNLFRIGGDEFTIIQEHLDEIDPYEFGKKIIQDLEVPYKIEGYELNITSSIGISIYPDDGETLKLLKINTDAALYRAKELGKNNVQLFTESLNVELLKRYTLEGDLRKAIQREEFILHYQPRVDTLTGKIVGAEALIRWQHPVMGMVPPFKFIPLAVETGMINDISHWVIEQVCKQLNKWKEKGCHLVPISINLSAKTLMKADLVPSIKDTLAKYSISPDLIEIEITEDSLFKNEGLGLSTIQQLREMGIKIALDDFGTGYSSIGYLRKFKVDFIKIDRSFIQDIDEDSTVVQSVILLAKGFKLKIVAEGVETEEQRKILEALQCHYIQGFLYSKPVPSVEFTKMIVES